MIELPKDIRHLIYDKLSPEDIFTLYNTCDIFQNDLNPDNYTNKYQYLRKRDDLLEGLLEFYVDTQKCIRLKSKFTSNNKALLLNKAININEKLIIGKIELSPHEYFPDLLKLIKKTKLFTINDDGYLYEFEFPKSEKYDCIWRWKLFNESNFTLKNSFTLPISDKIEENYLKEIYEFELPVLRAEFNLKKFRFIDGNGNLNNLCRRSRNAKQRYF